MQEALNEWLVMDEANLKFHMGQYEKPYRSTVKFLEFLEENLKSSKDNYICDFGCGAGAALDYLLCEGNKIFTRGYGIDISPEVIALGKRILNERKTKSVCT